ncbi:MAG: cytidine deaminase [Candidatus Marinimicrobia bacterium]|jgi:cytidine deaminase|nr:cytidine deaminase [Candidatus Neomarinimicrobiota bacterium]MDP6275700.1 cytidine deaminase [Candidatus Neomarinimicrobiota bacterium]MDP7331070.1 cytidine deaminase [Candidatus Neomarinimicrobiota bacterium]HBN45489.1 cytidine deaminase [Candidatus Neomarinimicrobiota bacterium]HJL74481.1 cytidine deaminase [Candidatus Neomarinimicrobiota bacterium]|tara:strand:- start:5289 stop:5669 length:381 start_codon:yes stop_codon:yes gene_type:complete
MDKLIAAAQAMRSRSHAPYSNYKVGAAILTDDGDIIGGCNIESSSYGLTCCAERVAIYRAVAEGHSSFQALAVVTENGGSLCGACRQVVWDLCGDIPIFIADQNNNIEETSTRQLLPEAFDQTKLK